MQTLRAQHKQLIKKAERSNGIFKFCHAFITSHQLEGQLQMLLLLKIERLFSESCFFFNLVFKSYNFKTTAKHVKKRNLKVVFYFLKTVFKNFNKHALNLT